MRILAPAVASLLFVWSMAAQVSPSTPKAARARITQGPELELANEYLTIIRWTTDNPGGSPLHYGVVHYGTNPKNLNQTAKSPVRLNPGHSATVFRVRMEGLRRGVTYYYTVECEEANGRSDGVKSSIRQFTIDRR
jgi:hypothetical protein